mmetsp:Transcript_41652/g.110553  ORF Transcript_41652/g.110553 Transcript_41652/m.110553 type:complete len:239 (-) Transcript_41652:3-719(-)
MVCPSSGLASAGARALGGQGVGLLPLLPQQDVQHAEQLVGGPRVPVLLELVGDLLTVLLPLHMTAKGGAAPHGRAEGHLEQLLHAECHYQVGGARLRTLVQVEDNILRHWMPRTWRVPLSPAQIASFAMRARVNNAAPQLVHRLRQIVHLADVLRQLAQAVQRPMRGLRSEHLGLAATYRLELVNARARWLLHLRSSGLSGPQLWLLGGARCPPPRVPGHGGGPAARAGQSVRAPSGQ